MYKGPEGRKCLKHSSTARGRVCGEEGKCKREIGNEVRVVSGRVWVMKSLV
jgi:hypothetical protein